jgi:cytochrome c peroxidase
MNQITIELVEFFVAIFFAIFFLYHLVRELQPKNQGLWILGLSLGTGVISFAVKIALIILFSSYSEPMLAMIATLPRISPQALNNIPSVKETFRFSSDDSAYTWEALPTVAPYPDDNPPSSKKAALGKKLFFDKRLSFDGTLSCASCHEISQEKGGSDGLATSTGIDHQKGGRNAPTVLNAAFQKVLFWDGRAASLEEQSKGPLVNPIEMGMPSEEKVVERVNEIKEYREMFAEAFGIGNDISINQISKALATYERTLITPNTPYDRFVMGDTHALSQKQIRGMVLFETMGCVFCHSGPNFSDASVYSNTPSYRIFPAIVDDELESKYHFSDDLGKAADDIKQKKLTSGGVWRIPTLRNIALTAPYFHNGSVDNLKDAVRIMARMQLNKTLSNRKVDDEYYSWSNADKKMHITTNEALSDDEVESLVEFLESLSGDVSVLASQ